VALAGIGIHVRVAIDVFALTVNYSFSPAVLVIFEWIVRLKPVGVDGQQLLLAVTEEESHGRFVGRFCWHNVSLTAATIDECEHRRFVFVIGSTTAC